MGLILDSSVLVAAERSGNNARQALAAISAALGDQEIGISTITLVELSHGVLRADTPGRKATRQSFIRELMMALPVHPVTAACALRAGEIDGESVSKGFRIPLADLLIGVTALEIGYGLATSNLRHFRLIPGLRIVQL